jgi:hypothetical protein
MTTPKYHAPLNWLGLVREELREQPVESVLQYCEVDVFNGLISELFLASLAVARTNSLMQPAPTRRLMKKLRERAYDLRTNLRELATVKLAATPSPAEFVFWPREWTHSAVLIPVARALNETGSTSQFVVSHPVTAREIYGHGIVPVCSYVSWRNESRRAWREGVQRARDLMRLFPVRLPNLGDTSGELLATRLKETIARLYPHVAAVTATTRAALDVVHPQTIVVGNDITTDGNVTCQVATKRGVATAVFMHGAISGNPLQSRHCADQIYAFGSLHRDEMIAQGISANRIRVCGNPYMDGRLHQSGTIHPQLKAKLSLQDGRPWILVATSGPGNRISHQHHECVVQALAELSRRMPEVPLIVKLHRKDREFHYRALLECPGRGTVHVIRDQSAGFPGDFLDWLQGCPLMLTGTSTTASEAMTLGVPVISMDFLGDIGPLDFIDAGATVHVRDIDSLEKAAKQVLSEGKLPAEVQSRVDEFLRVTFHSLDGKSSARAAEMLRQQLIRIDT